MNNQIALINGSFKSSVSVFDRGLSYGDGLFETMSWSFIAEKNGVGVEFWKRHLKRIKNSCSIIKIKMPSIKILNNYKEKILKKSYKNGIRQGILKILLTRGVGGRGYKFDRNMNPTVIFLSLPNVNRSFQFQKKGIEVKFCNSSISENSQLAGLKHLNRLDSVMARSEWNNNKFYEGVLSDKCGNIIEGTMTNLFFSKNNVLYTPSLSRCGINGIIRQVVIEKAKLFYKDIIEKDIKRNHIKTFDDMFVTNSVIKVLPVQKLGEKKFTLTYSTEKLVEYFNTDNGMFNNLELI